MTTWEEIQQYAVGEWIDDAEIAEVEKHLEYVGGVDLDSEPYEFWEIGVWRRKETGQLLWAEDSGCSCPIPFEGTLVSELIEVNPDTFVDMCVKKAKPQVRAEARKQAKEILKHG